MNVRIGDEARRDLREAVAFYESRQRGLGAALRKEVRSAIAKIVAAPEALQVFEAGLRRCRTERFPFGVIYAIEGGEIIILAIADLRRSPRNWGDRR